MIYTDLGHLLTCQCHGAERFVKKCHFSDLFSVDGSTLHYTSFYVGLPREGNGFTAWRSMLEFRMSRQLYILRSQGHWQIDVMKGFRGVGQSCNTPRRLDCFNGFTALMKY